MNIVDKSKVLAEYLGWKYVPSNNLQGFPKAGWYVLLTYHSSPKGATKIGDSYYTYICRNHHELRFYNSMDCLIKVLETLTKEDLSEYMYSWEQCIEGDEENCETEVCYNFMNIDYYISKEFGTIIEINLELDPSMEIGRGQGEGIIKNTFNACVEAVECINKIKHIL